jgi:hypothetical protein
MVYLEKRWDMVGSRVISGMGLMWRGVDVREWMRERKS